MLYADPTSFESYLIVGICNNGNHDYINAAKSNESRVTGTGSTLYTGGLPWLLLSAAARIRYNSGDCSWRTAKTERVCSTVLYHAVHRGCRLCVAGMQIADHM